VIHKTNLGRTGLERLHGPAEHLQLALGECGGACRGGGRSTGVLVGHDDAGVKRCDVESSRCGVVGSEVQEMMEYDGRGRRERSRCAS
jgi:hypothetical protein